MPVAISDRGIQTFLCYQRTQGEMEKLTRKDPLPLLCVGNRYLIEHQLEWLSDQGFKKMDVSLADRSQSTEALVETGSRWGTELVCTMDPEHLSFPERLRKHLSRVKGGILLVEGNAVLSFDFPAELTQSTLFFNRSQCMPLIYCNEQDLPALLACGEGEGIGDLCDWAQKNLPNVAKVTQPAFSQSICGIEDFLALNQDLQSNLSFFSFKGSEPKQGIKIGRMSHVSQPAKVTAPTLIGEGVVIKPETEIGPGAFIGDGSFVERGAKISNSVVAPGTYIGRNTCFEHHYICRNYVVDLSSRTSIFIEDPLILADLTRPTRWMVFWERLVATLLLVFTFIPMVALLPFHRVLRGRWLMCEKVLSQPVKKNLKGELDLNFYKRYYFDFGLFLLDMIPCLFDIAAGRLSFVGNPPIYEKDAERSEDFWDKDRFRGKAGCTGPVQQMDREKATPDEVFATTIYYSATRNAFGDLVLFLKALVPGVHRPIRKQKGATRHTNNA